MQEDAEPIVSVWAFGRLIVKVAFACNNCQAPFVVNAELAGRTGRCRKCGRRMVIPAPGPKESPAVSAQQRAVAKAGGAAATARSTNPRAVTPASEQPVAPANRPMSWRDAVTSQLGLKPLTRDALPTVGSSKATPPGPEEPKSEPEELESCYKLRPLPEDALPAHHSRKYEDPEDDESGSTYKLVIPRELRREMQGSGRVPQALRTGYAQGTKSYRQIFDMLARLSQWISRISYSFSLVFLVLAIAGGMVGQHSLAVFGLSAIVLLNVVGLAGDAVNLAMVSFRKNRVEGVLFLVPPITLIVLWTHWNRYRETVSRMMLPLMMLCLVMVAYMFVPWLKEGQPDPTTLGGRIEKAVESIEDRVGNSASEVH